ncbi:hypothetical protein ACTXT7_000603 [Hymenolepis weldensis]
MGFVSKKKIWKAFQLYGSVPRFSNVAHASKFMTSSTKRRTRPGLRKSGQLKYTETNLRYWEQYRQLSSRLSKAKL